MIPYVWKIRERAARRKAEQAGEPPPEGRPVQTWKDNLRDLSILALAIAVAFAIAAWLARGGG